MRHHFVTHRVTSPPAALVTLACLVLAVAASAPAHAGCPAALPIPGGAAVINVVNSNNGGAGSLRAALTAAGANTWIRVMPNVCGTTIGITMPLPALAAGRVYLTGCAAGAEPVIVKAAAAANGPGLRISSNQNYVCGLHVTGMDAAGIHIEGGEQNVVQGNVLSNNGGPGVYVHGVALTRLNQVVGNVVGRTALPLTSGNCRNNTSACAGIAVDRAMGTSDGTVVRDNIVVGTGRSLASSAAAGIYIIQGASHDVSRNWVGIVATGAGDGGNAGDGIVVDGVLAANVEANIIAYNRGSGVRLHEGSGARVVANTIGLVATASGAGGNGLDGVRVEGGAWHVVGDFGVPNTIGWNGGDGVHAAAATIGYTGPIITANDIVSNMGSGLEVEDGVLGTQAVANAFQTNGGYGVHLAAESQGTRLSQNRVIANALCAIRLERGANADMPAPASLGLDMNGDLAGFIVGPVGPGATLDLSGDMGLQAQPLGDGTVEVFWGSAPGAEADHYIGSVAVTASDFTWAIAAPAGMPADARVVATFTDAATLATTALSERCDGSDQDCDGLIDDAFDYDRDGFSTCGAWSGASAVAPDAVDCDDANNVVTPADVDADGKSMCTDPKDYYDCVGCGGISDDYDGDGTSAADDCCDGDDTLDCEDDDHDGYVTCPTACGRHHVGGNDPDDGDATVVPVDELCNGLDDDGDGRIDEDFDQDGDGVASCAGDCDDMSALTSPSSPERCGNGLDDDCDGTIDEAADADADGLTTCVSQGAPIDPNDAAPRGPGVRDDDLDGASNLVDCNDHDPSRNRIDFDGDGQTSCAGDCDDSQLGDPGCAMPRPARTFDVHIDAVTGEPTPRWVFVHRDDTVRWIFDAPADGTYPRDTILPVAWVGDAPGAPGELAALCRASPAPGAAGPLGANDFTGPTRALVPGVMTISPEDVGLVEEPVGPGACCAPGTATVIVGDRQLCKSGATAASMPSTWADARTSVVSLRVRWRDIAVAPGAYDFTDLDRELDAAVANGKSISLGVAAGKHGTPGWIFTTGCSDENGPVLDPATGLARTGVEPLDFEDGGDDLADEACGSAMTLGSPMDPMYQCHYFGFLRALADHIHTRAAWANAVTQLKLGGANMFTEENRVPERCKCGCICNTYVWATAHYGPWTPDGIRAFYAAEEVLLKELWPDVPASYMLIQGGLPNVADASVFDSCCDDACDVATPCGVPAAYCAATWTSDAKPLGVTGVSQLRDIEIDAIDGYTDPSGNVYDNAYGDRFITQHNGIAQLGVRTPNAYVLELSDGRDEDGDGLPDPHTTQPSGFQTTNLAKLTNPRQVQLAFDDIWQLSNAIFLEIYEARFWQATQTARELVDPTLGKTFAEYDADLLERRRDLADAYAWSAADLLPGHAFTFTSATVVNAPRYFPYVNGRGCGRAATLGQAPPFGVVVMVPN